MKIEYVMLVAVGSLGLVPALTPMAGAVSNRLRGSEYELPRTAAERSKMARSDQARILHANDGERPEPSHGFSGGRFDGERVSSESYAAHELDAEGNRAHAANRHGALGTSETGSETLGSSQQDARQPDTESSSTADALRNDGTVARQRSDDASRAPEDSDDDDAASDRARGRQTGQWVRGALQFVNGISEGATSRFYSYVGGATDIAAGAVASVPDVVRAVVDGSAYEATTAALSNPRAFASDVWTRVDGTLTSANAGFEGRVADVYASASSAPSFENGKTLGTAVLDAAVLGGVLLRAGAAVASNAGRLGIGTRAIAVPVAGAAALVLNTGSVANAQEPPPATVTPVADEDLQRAEGRRFGQFVRRFLDFPVGVMDGTMLRIADYVISVREGTLAFGSDADQLIRERKLPDFRFPTTVESAAQLMSEGKYLEAHSVVRDGAITLGFDMAQSVYDYGANIAGAFRLERGYDDGVVVGKAIVDGASVVVGARLIMKKGI